MFFMNQKAHSKRKSNITDNLLGWNTQPLLSQLCTACLQLDQQGLGDLEVELEALSMVPSLCAHNGD